MQKAMWLLFIVLALALPAMISPVVAQENYPAATVRLIVGYAPGGTVNLVARLLAQKLSAQMNGNVIVDNKPGANGNIGAALAAKSKPDGYTLLYNTSAVILSRAFGSEVDYDVFKDLVPVALVVSSPNLLVAHPSVPANNMADFVASVRANPDKFAYASAGLGSVSHLSALLILQINGLIALHVPYKGPDIQMSDLVAGRVQFAISSVTASLPLAKDKRIKALAITSLKRSPLVPDVPTLAETVMPGFEVGQWTGVMAPAQTPPAIVKRLNGEILKALQDAEMNSRLAQEVANPLGSTPEEYSGYLRSELERWTKVAKTSGLKLE